MAYLNGHPFEGAGLDEPSFIAAHTRTLPPLGNPWIHDTRL